MHVAVDGFKLGDVPCQDIGWSHSAVDDSSLCMNPERDIANSTGHLSFCGINVIPQTPCKLLLLVFFFFFVSTLLILQ